MTRRELEMWAIGFMHGRTREDALAHITEQQQIDPAPDFWHYVEGYIRAAYPEPKIKTYRAFNRQGREVRVTIPED
jgi:hypothetical protein